MNKISYLEKKKIKKIISKIACYTILIIIGFTFIKPLIYSLSTSIKSLEDITNPSVNLIAQNPTIQNYRDILEKFEIIKVLLFTIFYVATVSFIQTFSCAMTGYGLAKYDFKFKKIIMILIVVIFVIPPQTLMTPNFVLMGQLNLTNSLLAFFIPALFAQGMKSSIFILIFYSFFKAVPNDIYESAQMEGAKPLTIFFKITLPLVKGAVIITYVLSFVWYFNESYLTNLYYSGIKTYQLEIARIVDSILEADPNKLTEVPIYDGIMAAAVIIMMIPLIIFYFIIQKQFKQGIENSAMTGQ